ncbi:AbrB/MazE/SpoVT family DNA-binding domain-containing protein [Methylobacterium sp. J-067]|uniref:AbrB/MazE/SpoVT family DNA-binding domain-containing protein n=1 Tax=Methylobacterium sp. J-067 TaxID=2836648 RepID=UPI001FBA5B3D|nr:AbrB/MazE/SpoVT family DNA-binding domain-containing protein [Methylobacterium sp. J-067]MCJ2027679.1 AbrB/MazE/SpoVT family DNA-binding domain-containing protein [Methylobacterium sp. J-067]
MSQRWTIQVAEDGGMRLPADICQSLGLKGAGRIVLTQDDAGIHLTMAENALERARASAAPYRNGSGSVVYDFIAERRAAGAEV